jgi:hypothetical protein
VIDLLTCFAPHAIHVGSDPRTGEPVSVPTDHYLRGLNIVGQVGSGKTDFVLELLRANSFSGRAWAYLDMAGTGFASMAAFDALAATLLHLGIELLYGDLLPEVRDLAARFSRRHHYADVGETDPGVRVNILRRLRRKDGRLEDPQRVAGRFVGLWATQFDDLEIRVRFSKWCTVAATLLAAADRAIPEYALLFESDDYRAFLRREQTRLGTAGDAFVQEQWRILEAQYLALRKQPGDAPNRAQLEELGSVHNALAPLRCGPMATFFGGHENVSLERIAYDGERLYVTTTKLANTLQRAFTLRAVWSALDGLIAEIRQDDPHPISFAVFDEVQQLTSEHLHSFATLRNHRWSPVLLRQTHDAQFEAMGLRAAPAILEQCMQYAVYYRPETEAIARAMAIRGPVPDYEALIVTVLASSAGWSATHAGNVARTWVESFGEGGGSHGGSEGQAWSDGTSGGVSEQHLRIPTDEFLLRRALAYVQLPEYTAVHVYKGATRTIRHRRARQLPPRLFGTDYTARYLAANRALHDRDAAPYRAYDPTIALAPRATVPIASVTVGGAAAPYRPTRDDRDAHRVQQAERSTP